MHSFNGLEYAWLFFAVVAVPWRESPIASRMCIVLLASMGVHAVDSPAVILSMVMGAAIVLALLWRIQEWPTVMQSAKLGLVVQFFGVTCLGLMASGACVTMVALVPDYPPVLWTLWGVFTHALLSVLMLGGPQDLPGDFWLSAGVWCATDVVSMLPWLRGLEQWLLIWSISFLPWLFWNECCCQCFRTATQRMQQQQQTYQRTATVEDPHFEIGVSSSAQSVTCGL